MLRESEKTYPIKDPNDHILVSLREGLKAENEGKPGSIADESYNYHRLPIIGRVWFLRDQNGIMLLGCIVAYWIYGVWSSYYVIIEPHYRDGHIYSVFFYYHFIVAAMCLLSLITAATKNPGRLPKVDSTFAESHDWVPCPTCNKYRPPRAHHCRRCKQCVVRMDHHCPWINNCVGENNHYIFTMLLFYACLFGTNTFIFLMLHFWYWPKCVSCDQESFVIKHGIWFQYLSTVMSAAMAFFMFMQLTTQHFNIIMDRTTLDNMKLKNIYDIDPATVQIREFWNAYRDHCGTWKCFLWFWPCRKRRSTLMYGINAA